MRLVLVQRCLIIAAVLLFASALSAAESVDYFRDIKPIFKKHCYVCHGSFKQQGAFRADTANAILSGGDSGPAVEPSSSNGSNLLGRLTDTNKATRMPQESAPLSSNEIAMIAAWIEQTGKGDILLFPR